jgi:hypothetical protein
VICVFGRSPPEDRKKLEEQCSTMDAKWSVVVGIEAAAREVCSIVATLSWSSVGCVAAGAMVGFVGGGRVSH